MTSPDARAALSLLDRCSQGFMVSQVLFAACELGVFDLLAEAPEPLDAATVARRLGTSSRGTELLLDTCVSLKLLQVQMTSGKALYENTELSNTYLVRSSPRSQSNMMLYMARTTYLCWAHLAQAVREGKNQYVKAFGVPSEQLFTAIYRSEGERLLFMRGLQDIWSVHGRSVLAAFDLSPFPRVCDLGGESVLQMLQLRLNFCVGSVQTLALTVLNQGQERRSLCPLLGCSGALAKECVSLYPGCRVTVFDIPAVIQAAKAHFLVAGEERISFQEGDFFEDPLPEADLYVLARVLHDWTDDRCSYLLARIHRACPPGGGVLVIESLLDADGRGPLTTQLYSLNMLVQTEGRERTPAQYRALLAAAGFRDVLCQRTGGTYDAVLARK
ncbi:acetylserotonin O-methyltransferase isoform X2 [Molossus molossus]|uniref:acetylserotonin O-methyltransferase isoform X2 n=1 Tax=Molossus molossus TaxID=27622 RepID=UPI0017460DAD|nr:acetylserotonin O-methyltransferase isoform X2 [Molossus molossus]